MILDEKINKLVNDICKLHRSNDNEVFFSKIQLLLIDCSNLLDNNIFHEYERLMIKQANKYWLEKGNYLNEILKLLREVV